MKRSFFPFFVVLGAVAVGLCLTLRPPLFAQEDEISGLRQRVTELEQKVELLEILLKECTEARQKQEASSYGWQNKKNWRSLQIGMSESQVREALGEPVKVIQGIKTLWYYPNFYGGYVSFDENGNLTGWNEP
jgi:outer membrane protein assembly factor BamE (lipoprotein component of BamABCDE complex)